MMAQVLAVWFACWSDQRRRRYIGEERVDLPNMNQVAARDFQEACRAVGFPPVLPSGGTVTGVALFRYRPCLSFKDVVPEEMRAQLDFWRYAVDEQMEMGFNVFHAFDILEAHRLEQPLPVKELTSRRPRTCSSILSTA